jgi:hypothetical protein
VSRISKRRRRRPPLGLVDRLHATKTRAIRVPSFGFWDADSVTARNNAFFSKSLTDQGFSTNVING